MNNNNKKVIKGRPSKLTPEIKTTVCKAVSMGLSQSIAANLVGVKPMTLNNWLKKDEEFQLDVREAIANQVIHRTAQLLKLCDNGNTAAIIFWLKTKAGFSERSTIEHTGTVEHLHASDVSSLIDVETSLTKSITSLKRKKLPPAEA